MLQFAKSIRIENWIINRWITLTFSKRVKNAYRGPSFSNLLAKSAKSQNPKTFKEAFEIC